MLRYPITYKNICSITNVDYVQTHRKTVTGECTNSNICSATVVTHPINTHMRWFTWERACILTLLSSVTCPASSFDVLCHVRPSPSPRPPHWREELTRRHATKEDMPVKATVRVEQVATEDRSLDVLVFRDICESPKDLVLRRKGGLTEAEATALLLHQRAKTLERTRASGIVQFVAVSDGTEYDHTSGVMGAVDAEFVEGARALTFELPHRVHMKNLRVDENFRRRGVGTALLSAVVQYALAQTPAQMVSLEVERKNEDAVKLYERVGFVFSEGVYAGFMTKNINH